MSSLISFDFLIDMDERHRIILTRNLKHLDLAVSKCSYRSVQQDFASQLPNFRIAYQQFKHMRSILYKLGIDITDVTKKIFKNELEQMPEFISLTPWHKFYFMEMPRAVYIRYSFNVLNHIKLAVEKSNEISDIQRFIKAIEVMNYCKGGRRDVNIFEVLKCFECFLNFILILIEKGRSVSLCHAVVIDALKVFCVADYMKRRIFLLSEENFKLVITSIRLQKRNLCKFMNRDIVFDPVIFCLTENLLSSLSFLLKCGYRNEESLSLCDELKMFVSRNISLFDYIDADDWLEKLPYEGRKTFLFLQVLALYLLNVVENKKSEPSNLPSDSLILLWKSIADPFLTMIDFRRFCNRWDGIKYDLACCFMWYNKHMLEHIHRDSDAEFIYKDKQTPRSLQHLSRCCIRKRLTENYLVTSEVNWRDLIPRIVITYLEI